MEAVGSENCGRAEKVDRPLFHRGSFLPALLPGLCAEATADSGSSRTRAAPRQAKPAG